MPNMEIQEEEHQNLSDFIMRLQSRTMHRRLTFVALEEQLFSFFATGFN